MSKKLKILCAVLLLSGYCHTGYGQECSKVDTIGVKVYFRQGYSLFEPAFSGNSVRLETFVARLREAERDTLQQFRTIRVAGGASPEGVLKLNERLAGKRAENLVAWLKENLSMPGLTYNTESVGVDWDGLSRLVQASDMPYRDEVLDIIKNTPVWVVRNDKVVDGRIRQLQMLHGGRAWWYIYEHFFPELRSSGLSVYCEITRQSPPEPEPAPEIVEQPKTEPEIEIEPAPEPVTEVVGQPVAQERKPFYMALKTNLLYDTALIPNLGLEFYLGKGWTAGGNWMYAWWNNDNRHRYWRVYGGELDIRKYFGRRAKEKPLTGHHLGLYGQMLTYDFETGGKGYLGGKPGGTLWDKMNWGVGLEYGYSLPLGRRLNLDFVVGVGYLGGEYCIYKPVDNHYVWQQTKQLHWFGPTKAEISLVWLLGRGNYNEKKGGKR